MTDALTIAETCRLSGATEAVVMDALAMGIVRRSGVNAGSLSIGRLAPNGRRSIAPSRQFGSKPRCPSLLIHTRPQNVAIKITEAGWQV
jgi:hypothetical protein